MSLEVVEWDVVRLAPVPLWVAVSFGRGGGVLHAQQASAGDDDSVQILVNRLGLESCRFKPLSAVRQSLAGERQAA